MHHRLLFLQAYNTFNISVKYYFQDGYGLNGTATLLIKVLDIQNKPPYFTGQPFKAHVLEESPIGTIVSNLSIIYGH